MFVFGTTANVHMSFKSNHSTQNTALRLGMSEFKGARITLINTVKSVDLLCRCKIRPKSSSQHVLDCVSARELTVLQPNLTWMQHDYFCEQV